MDDKGVKDIENGDLIKKPKEICQRYLAVFMIFGISIGVLSGIILKKLTICTSLGVSLGIILGIIVDGQGMGDEND